MKSYIFLLSAIFFNSVAQFERLGSEVKSNVKFGYGTYNLSLIKDYQSKVTTSFLLKLNNSSSDNWIGFLCTDTSIIGFYQKDFFYDSFEISKNGESINLKVRYTSDSTQLFVNDSLCKTLQLKNEQNETIVYLNVCTDNVQTMADTSVTKFNKFEYFELNGNLKIKDDFKIFDYKVWQKSTEKYLENKATNDTSLVFIEDGLQLISLAFKKKITKGIFKRENEGEYIAKAKKAWLLDADKKMIAVEFRDSIYVNDKRVSNFYCKKAKVLKTKLKSDYKTVLLVLDSIPDTEFEIVYKPLLGRFRKPQIIPISK